MSNIGTALAMIGAGMGGYVQGRQRAQDAEIERQKAQDDHDRAQAEASAARLLTRQRQMELDRQQQINDLTGQIAQKSDGNWATPDQVNQSGLSAPSAALVMSPQGGYGAGVQGLQAATSDYDREGQRFSGMAQDDGVAIPSPTGAPRAAGIDTSQRFNYTPRARYGDIYQLAALRGDQAGMIQAQAGMRQEDFRTNVASALSDWQKMTPLQQSQWAHDMAFGNGAGNVLVSNRNPKTGMTEVALTNDNGEVQKRVNLQPAELAQLYVAHNLDPQFSDEAMKLMSESSKNLREIIDHYNTTSNEVAKTNNTATYQGQVASAEKEGADARMVEAGAMRDRTAALERDGRMGAVQYFKMPDGSTQGFMPSMSKGKLTWQPLTLPQGAVPFRQSGQQSDVKVDSNGLIVKGGEVYAPDPKDPTKYKKVNLGPSALDLALARDDGKGSPAPPPGAGLPLPPRRQQVFRPDPVLEARLQSEMTDMGAGKRMNFSPDVADYYKQRREAQDAAGAAQEQVEAQAIAAQQQRRRAALGY